MRTSYCRQAGVTDTPQDPLTRQERLIEIAIPNALRPISLKEDQASNFRREHARQVSDRQMGLNATAIFVAVWKLLIHFQSGQFVPQSPHNSRRNPGNGAVGRDRVEHYAASTDFGSFSDFDIA